MSERPRRISVDDLRRVVAGLPAEVRDFPGGRSITLANAIISHFLGRAWHTAHIPAGTAKPGFMRLDFSSDRRREASAFRVIHLAENLYNLQMIEGFDACIAQMQEADGKIESTYAELDVGRLLYLNNVVFRFVIPKNTPGLDYDLELTLFGSVRVPAETKCKFEATAINPNSILSSLSRARGQLPKDRAGIIFVKVPQTWISEPATAISLAAVAGEFLKNSGRVVSVKFYVSQLVLANNMVGHFDQYREVTNLASRYHEGRDWDLFPEGPPLSSWNGLPDKWQRIFNFPGAAIPHEEAGL